MKFGFERIRGINTCGTMGATMNCADVIGKYRIVKPLGRGGEGLVFLAVHMQTEQLWILKVIKGRADSMRMREVQTLKRLHHPALPVLIDVLEIPEGICMVMEYVRGRNLEEVMRQKGHLSAPQVLEAGIALCEALGYLHTRKHPVLHLDMKPANVMLTPKGQLRLVDFGAAERIGERYEQHFGTDGFAAPEQYEPGRLLDERADIYGVGATLYYLICGVRFSQFQIKSKVPGCPDLLGKVIRTCLHKEPEQRYASCAQLRGQLQTVKKQLAGTKRRLRTEAALALALTALALTGGYMEKEFRAKAQEAFDYGGIVREAACAQGEERLALYRKAVYLEPGKGEAYARLLEDAAYDGRFDREEERQIRLLLHTIPPGKEESFEQQLAGNAESYASTAYQLGLLYLFDYEEAGREQIAHGWFVKAQEAAEGCAEAPGWLKSARLFDVLTGYGGMEGSLASPEEERVRWWKALTGLTFEKERWEISEPLRLKCALSSMEQLLTCTDVLWGSGVTADELEEGTARIAALAEREEEGEEEGEECQADMEQGSKMTDAEVEQGGGIGEIGAELGGHTEESRVEDTLRRKLKERIGQVRRQIEQLRKKE